MYEKLTATFLAALIVLSGGSAFALATGAHEDVTENRIVSGINLQQQPSQVLVFADDYTPETSFRVITRLKQGAVRDILGQTVNDRPIISETSDYSGYVVHLQSTADVHGEYGLVFVNRNEGRLVTGNQYQFAADAAFFMVDVNLLEVDIRSVGGGATPEEGTPTPTPEGETPTPAPEEATLTPTPGEGTPTPEAGTPTPTPEGDTPTPTPDAEAVAPEQTPTAAQQEEDGGIISGFVDFFSGLFGGGGEDGGQQTTTVEGGAS